MSISDQQTILPLDETSVYPDITSTPEVISDKEPGVYNYPVVTDIFPVRSSGDDSMGINIKLLGGSVAGVNIIEIPTCINIASLPDLYNFGYKLKIIETDATLSRISHFTYADALSTNVIQLTSYDSGWRLDYNSNIYNNNNQTPEGLYTGVTTLSVIYLNE